MKQLIAILVSFYPLLVCADNLNDAVIQHVSNEHSQEVKNGDFASHKAVVGHNMASSTQRAGQAIQNKGALSFAKTLNSSNHTSVVAIQKQKDAKKK